MAFQPVPFCALADLVFSTNSQRTENTLWFRTNVTPTASDLDALGGGIAAWWTAEMAPIISTDCALVQIDVTWKAVSTGPQAIFTTGLPDAGNAPTESLSNGVALVVKFGTTSIGRSYRGRNYIAGLPNSAAVNSVFTTGTVSDVITAYNALGSYVGSGGWSHVVVSRRQNGVLLASAVATPVASYVVTTPSTRSQRRRNPGVGA